MKIFPLIVLFIIVPRIATGQVTLVSGPMVGHVDMREARLWVHLSGEATVWARYADSATPRRSYSTTPVRTSAQHGYVATLVCDSAEPGRTYFYTIVVDGKDVVRPYPTFFRTQPIWKWRPTPPPTRTMALGSCFYVNEEGYERSSGGYGANYHICRIIDSIHPDVMLWLGDNVYLREPDWGSRSGMLKRYSHTRALPELQPLLARTAHYATWDDHDYGPNDADRGWHLKDDARDVFRLFWPNPSCGLRGQGITAQFSMADVDVFLLDDRWWRSADKRMDQPRTMIGQEQFDWLLDALHASTATFKIIALGSQVLTDNLRKECYSRMPEERQRLLDALENSGINGIVMVSGDIHASELSRLDRPGRYPLYEFTCSSLTAGSNKDIDQQSNRYRIPGTTVGVNNAGFITVSGPAKARSLTFRVVDANGTERWSRTITEQELSMPK